MTTSNTKERVLLVLSNYIVAAKAARSIDLETVLKDVKNDIEYIFDQEPVDVAEPPC